MVYTFARVGVAVSMKVEDFFVQGRRGWMRLQEKGGKEHEMPTHHNLDRYLEEYIAAAGIADDRKSRLFRTTRGRSGKLTDNSLLQFDVWRMIRRRALATGIQTEIGCHTFRATGITAYLKKMAASWKSPSKWPLMSRPERPASMTGATTGSRSMR
jgi:integrase